MRLLYAALVLAIASNAAAQQTLTVLSSNATNTLIHELHPAFEKATGWTLRVKFDNSAALKTRIGRFPDRAILGCTHYQLAADLFRAALPPGTPLIHQPAATAQAMERYFARHPEYETGHSSLRRFLTTGEPGPQNALVASFWGEPLVFEAA